MQCYKIYMYRHWEGQEVGIDIPILSVRLKKQLTFFSKRINNKPLIVNSVTVC